MLLFILGFIVLMRLKISHRLWLNYIIQAGVNFTLQTDFIRLK